MEYLFKWNIYLNGMLLQKYFDPMPYINQSDAPSSHQFKYDAFYVFHNAVIPWCIG
jgi:hypothetical protein